MKTFKEFVSEVKSSTGKLKDACWKGYTAIGTKKKNGKTVPNCVPEEYIAEAQEYLNRPELESKIGKGGMSSIMKHPFFKKHVIDSAVVEPKFRHSKLSDFSSQVESISQPNKFVSFDMIGSGKRQRVGNAHLFRWDGKSRHSDGNKVWIHHSSFHEDES